MKKLFVILVFMLLPIQFIIADEFTEGLPVIDVSVQKVDGKAIFDSNNIYSYGSPGDPMLPVYFVRFILPDTADESSVVLTVSDLQVIETTEVFDVDPVPPECNDMACVDVYWPNPENIDENGRNTNKYSFGDYINNAWIADYSVSSYKSMKMVTVEMFSHDWNPSTGKIKKLTGGVLNLAYSNNSSEDNYIKVSHFSPNNVENIAFFLNNSVNGSELIVKNEFGNEYLLPELNSYLFNYYNNYPLFHNVFTQQSKKNSLYIISTNNIVMNSRVLGRYIKSKISRNFDVTVVTEDKTFINGLNKSINYGWEKPMFTQKADMIRNYLTAGRRYEYIDYLLLVGDPHPGGCGSTSGYDYYNGFGSVDINDDCKFDGTNEGSVPMKWINLYASSTKTSYSRGGGSFIDSDDLRRALPTDKYYSVLSIDWPVDTNGNTGDGINAKFYRSEVQKNDLILGRIPVYNNDVSTLDSYLNKVLRYENNLRSSVDSWRLNVFAPLDYWDTGSMPNHIDDTPVWEFGERLKSEIINSNSNYSVSLMLRGDSFNHTYTKGVDPDPMHGIPFEQKCSEVLFNQTLFREVNSCNVVPGGDTTCLTPEDITKCWVTLHYENFFPTENDDFGDMGLNFNLATIENRWNAGYGATIISSHGGVIGGLSELNLDDYYSGHVFIGACSAGWPENKYVLSKRLLENGAMTTIAAGRATILNRTIFNQNNGQFETSYKNDRWSINQMSLEYAKFLAQDFITSGKAFSKSFTELSFNVNARNYLLYNFYGDPAIGPMTWKESGSDIDNDGVIDSFDNCPGLENILQTDSDGDGVGDACDNCSGVPNGWEVNNSEIVVAPCDNGVGGAYCLDDTKDHVYRDVNGDFHWQPDHDLDGEGDACDGGQVWAAFPNMPLNKSFSNVVVDNPAFTQYNIFPSRSISVDLEILSAGISVPLSLRATTRFCWLTPDDFSSNLWGDYGYCTTEAGINDNCIVDFGYSHGSDPKPIVPNIEFDYIETWKKPTLSGQKEFTQITTNQSETVTWNWRQDFMKDRPEEVIVNALSNAPLCDEYDAVTGNCVSSSDNILSFYHTLSTGVKGFDDNYIIIQPDPEGGNENVNSGYFRNTQRYTRSQRLKTDPVPISYFYYEKTVAHDLGHEYCLGAPCNFPIDELRREFFQETIRDLVTGPDIFERTGMDHFFKNEFGSDLLSGSAVLSEWNINSSGASSVKTSARPQYLATVAKNSAGFNMGLEAVPTGMQFMGYFPESTQNITYNLVKMTQGSNGDWRTVGVLSNLPDYFNPVNSVYHNGDLFVISKEVTNAAILKKIYVINPVSLNGNTCTGSNNIYEPVFIDDLPDISNASLYSFTGGLYIIGEGGNGMEVHKLAQQSGDYYTVNITGSTMPSLRDTYTAAVRDDVLYIAGGAAVNGDDIDFKTDIWKFTEADGWTMIRNDLNLFPASFRIDFDGDDIVLTNRIVKSDSTTEKISFNADGSGDTPVPETIEVEGAVPLSVNDSYCLNETDNILKGGLDASGACIPFTHQWYNSFSAGATVYSVAGKGGRLYVGTDGLITVYDISDSASMTYVAEYSTGGERVYDLEVAGSEMYAATSGGIYRFDISDPYMITLINSLSTGYYNYQYRIQLYNDLLYVGDDNGINIRDKETFARISYVNDGAMLDFTISDGNIALYSSALFSSNVQVRDVDSLNLVAWEYADCYTGELTSDHGELYLSCDGYDYRFEIGSGTVNFYTLDADILEMQENHVNNGFVYIPDGSSIKLSTNNDVPSLCGNGIIEPGEICDGDSVACTDLNAAYYGGTAYCNSTCDGYDEGSCETDDGW